MHKPTLVAKEITDRVADLIDNLDNRSLPLHCDAARNYARGLRVDADLAYLDGYVGRSRALNKLADKLVLAALKQQMIAGLLALGYVLYARSKRYEAYRSGDETSVILVGKSGDLRYGGTIAGSFAASTGRVLRQTDGIAVSDARKAQILAAGEAS